MATVALSPIFNGYQAFSSDGVPLRLGAIETYQAGTSTPLATYTTAAGNIANANPILLLTDGRPPQEIWLIVGSAYRFVLKDALGNQIGTYDDIQGADAAGAASQLRADLASTASASLGVALNGYNPALAYAAGLGQFLNFVFGRTSDEIAAGITPSNFAYGRPGDVRRYGGVMGTTAANDATNATAYLRACNGGGGQVYFPAGVFRWNAETLCTRGNITFFGDGKGVSILRPVGWISAITVADVYPAATTILENVTVRDLTIDGSLQTVGANDTYGNGINLVACDKVKVFNVETKDVKFQHIVSTYYVIGARQQVSIQVMGCDIEGVRVNQIGIGLEGAGRGAVVSGNTISDCAGDGVQLSYNNVVSAGPGTSVVSDNVIQGATGGTARGIFMGNNVTRVVVAGNLISGFDISIRGSYDSSLGAGSTCGDYVITGNRCSEWTTGGIYVFPMQGTDDSKAHIADNRITSSLAAGGSIGIYASKGSKVLDNTITDAATGIQVASGATGARIAGNMNSCTTRVNDLGTGTVIEDEAVTFAPIWSSSGTQPAIGNGSIVGRYVRNGSGWKAWYQITFGSTTTYGTGVYFFSLPFALSGGISFVTGSANVTDTGTNEYTCIARGDNTNGIRLLTTVSPATTVAAMVPFTFGNTDTIYIEISGPTVT
jgi:hypothetical protein